MSKDDPNMLSCWIKDGRLEGSVRSFGMTSFSRCEGNFRNDVGRLSHMVQVYSEFSEHEEGVILLIGGSPKLDASAQQEVLLVYLTPDAALALGHLLASSKERGR